MNTQEVVCSSAWKKAVNKLGAVVISVPKTERIKENKGKIQASKTWAQAGAGLLSRRDSRASRSRAVSALRGGDGWS